MSTDRELILQQALLAVVGAAVEMGLESDFLVAAAMQGLVDGARYRRIDREYLPLVFVAMTEAHSAQVIGSCKLKRRTGEKEDVAISTSD